MQEPQTTVRTVARLALGTLSAVVSAGLVLLAAPGWAHVSVNPDTATRGGSTALSFRVPNETESTSTTRVQLFLPQDHPIASVSVRPHPGWHTRVVTKKLATPLSTDDGEVTEAVYSITWTADSARDALKPGEYDEFDISVGPLPDVPTLTFKALQSYSDATVVRWIDPPAAPGQPEPEHPAPTLTLVSATGGSSADPGDGSGGSDGTATTALVLAIVALLLGGGTLTTVLLRRRT